MSPNNFASASALIPTLQGVLNQREQVLVNARDLHTFIESKQEFANWLKKRIADYGFVEGQDYITFDKKINRENQGLTGWKTPIEYQLSLEMAKELSMVERNEKGRIARRYFISVEQAALAHLQQREELIEDLKDMLVQRTLRYQQMYRYINKGLTQQEIGRCMQISARAVRKILSEMQQLELMPNQQHFVFAHNGRIARSGSFDENRPKWAGLSPTGAARGKTSQLPLLGE